MVEFRVSIIMLIILQVFLLLQRWVVWDKLISNVMHITFFNGMINIKSLDLNSIEIDKKSYNKESFIYFICYVATNDVSSILYFVTKDGNK